MLTKDLPFPALQVPDNIIQSQDGPNDQMSDGENGTTLTTAESKRKKQWQKQAVSLSDESLIHMYNFFD
jgi:hypothetical protein